MKPDSISSKQWLRYNYYFILEHFLGVENARKYLDKGRKNLFDSFLSQSSSIDRGEIIDTKTIEFESFDDFKDNHNALLHQPVVFRGAALDWPCVQKWSKDFFREHYSQTQISIIDNPGLVDNSKTNEYQKKDFASYLDEVEEDKSKYLRFSRILDNNPVLLEDLDLTWLRKSKKGWTMGEQTFLFMGEEGTITPTHAGLTHTTFIQVAGKKKWTLWAPNERFFLDPFADRVLYYYTHADPYVKKDDRYPLMNYAKKYELVLDKGDILWFPSLFWHHITNLTPTIGVAFKYTNLPESFKISSVLSTLFFMATKPSIFRSFFYNRQNKQDLVFDRKSVK